MNSNLSMGNRLLQAKKIERDHYTHLQYLRQVKPTIDFTSKQVGVEINRGKQLQRKETQIKLIEKENRMLFDKITSIMDSHKRSAASGVLLTKHPDQWHLPLKNPKTKKHTAFFPVKSLNLTVRKQNFMRIANENLGLLKRIHEQKPSYDFFHNHDVSTRSTYTPSNYAPIPLNLKHPAPKMLSQDSQLGLRPKLSSRQRNRSQQGSHGNTQNDLYGQSSTSEQCPESVVVLKKGDSNSRFSQRGQSAHSALRSTSRKRSRATTQTSSNVGDINNTQQSSMDQSEMFLASENSVQVQVLLEKQRKAVCGVDFYIEIMLTQDSMVILAEEVVGDETKIIEIPRTSALNFMAEQCSNSVEELVALLHLENGQIYLIEKKKEQQPQLEKIAVTTTTTTATESAQKPLPPTQGAVLRRKRASSAYQMKKAGGGSIRTTGGSQMDNYEVIPNIPAGFDKVVRK